MKLFKTPIFLMLLADLVGVVYAAEESGPSRMSEGGMMNDCMMMSGWMMLVYLLFGLLILAILILAILALIKYLRGDKS
jgi:hypothetical protein